jgi:hypothetical protein
MLRWLMLILAISLHAQDWGGLHLFNADIAINKQWTVQIHTRVRTNENFSHFFQRRGGPIVFYQAKPRFALVGGYYSLNEENGERVDWNFHRVWGGFLTTPLRTSKFTLEARTLGEKFMNAPSGDFVRVRQRILGVWGRGQWRPYAQAEGLVAQGHWTGRWTAGTQFWPEGRKFFATLGYEYRMNPNGTHMHLIASTWQFRLRKLKS